MLRRDIRDSYHAFTPDRERKEAILNEILQQRNRNTLQKGKKWKPKGQVGPWILIALLLCAVVCGTVFALNYFGVFAAIREMIPQTEPSTEVATVQQTQPQTTEPIATDVPTYADLIEVYMKAIETGYDIGQCEAVSISRLVSFLEDPRQLSYAKQDLDGDGVEELIITDGNVIYDLYTYSSGQLVHILSGSERNAYTLTAENQIVNVATNGAASMIYTFYWYMGGHMIVDQMVILDAQRDAANPWFRGITDIESATPITQAEAKSIIDSYPGIAISCTPIPEYK